MGGRFAFHPIHYATGSAVIRTARLTWHLVFHYHLTMTGAEVKRIRKALGLTQRQFAESVGVHVVTVAKWETDTQGIRGPAVRLMRLLGATREAKPSPRKLHTRQMATKRRKGAR
jgi:DNA-binding transcriptional regulator YiaG